MRSNSGYGFVRLASEYGSSEKIGTPGAGSSAPLASTSNLRAPRYRLLDGLHSCQNKRIADHAFIVELNDGSEIAVAADQSILDAIETSGRRVLTSCREGNCGTCETDVISGAIDHRDHVLDDDEQAAGDVMMICVSRAAGDRLKLDL